MLWGEMLLGFTRTFDPARHWRLCRHTSLPKATARVQCEFASSARHWTLSGRCAQSCVFIPHATSRLNQSPTTLTTRQAASYGGSAGAIIVEIHPDSPLGSRLRKGDRCVAEGV